LNNVCPILCSNFSPVLLQVKEIFAEDRQMAIEILHDIGELEKKEKQSENVERRQDVSSRTLEHVPSRISALLQSCSPWVRQSLGPEISRCYRVGGDELMVRYARAKLQHIKNQTQWRHSHSRRNIHSVEGSMDFIQEPKREGIGEGADVEARELDYNMDDTLVEKECEIRDTVEKEHEVRESEEKRLKDRENVEVECGMMETVEEGFAVMETGIEGFEVRETVEEGIEDRETVDTEFGTRETDGRELGVRETVEVTVGMRDTSEEENQLGSALVEANDVAQPSDLEKEVGEILEEGNEVREVLGRKVKMGSSMEKEVMMEDILEEDGRSANVHIKDTVSQNKYKQDTDSGTPSANNVTLKARRGGHTASTPVVSGEINITFSSNISAIDSETVYFRPQEDR
jgi:hypothetical protein